MKNLKTILIIMLMACTGSIVYGEPSNQKTSKVVIALQKSRGANSQNKPKSPDRQVISCAYDGEVMELHFAFSEGVVDIAISDAEMQEAVYSLDSSSLEIYIPIPDLVGPINITLNTERGVSYEGSIEY